jgi:hypothetical protein
VNRVLLAVAILLSLSSAFAQIKMSGQTTTSANLSNFGTVSTPVITTTTLAAGTQGSTYAQTLAVSGGTAPFCWQETSSTLPAGLTLDGGTISGGNCTVAGTGAISGTPTTPGTFNTTFKVTDSAGLSDGPKLISILINPSSALSLLPRSLPSVISGSVYPTTLITATGGVPPYQLCTFPVPLSVPAGLTKTVVNGTLSGCQLGGTITAAPNSGYSFPVQITDSVGATASNNYTITVNTAGSGPPTAFTHARVDLCETGLETGCGGKGMKFDGTPATMGQIPVLWETNVTNGPFACASPPCHRIGLNKSAFDPDFGAFLIRASDKFSPCNNGQYGISGASGGDVPWIGLTDTTLAVPTAMFLTESSGTRFCLNYYAPSTHTVTYSVITGGGGPNGSPTQFATGASVSASGTQPKHLFEFIASKNQDVINDLLIDNDPANVGSTFDTIKQRTPFRDLINGGANCLPAGYGTLSTAPWTGTFNVSADDTKITIGFSGTGGQGSGFEAVRVDASKSGCRYFVFAYVTGTWTTGKAYALNNTLTPAVNNTHKDRFKVVTPGTSGGSEPNWDSVAVGGTITDGATLVWKNDGSADAGVRGDWGCHYTAGAGTGTCTPDTPGVTYPFVTDNPDICNATPLPCAIDDQFTLHGVQQSPDPAWFSTGVNNSTCMPGHQCSCNKVNGGCQEYFFFGDTNLVEPCSVCAGHNANGFGYTYKQPQGGISPLRRISRARPTVNGIANPGTIMSPSLPSDYHGSGNADGDVNDSAPISFALADEVNTNTQGRGWTNRPAYPAALYGEIIGCSTLSIGTCYRFAHSFNSTLELAFAPVENIFVESPEGTWGYMMTDMMGNFGSYNGAENCNMVGGDGWHKSNSYVSGDEMTVLAPVAHGANFHSVNFKVTTPGTSSATLPAKLNGVPWSNNAAWTLNSWAIPRNNNTALDLFQVTTAGVTGTIEPNWDGTCASTCTESRGAWQSAHLYTTNTTLTPTNNNASGFLFQVTTKGTSGGIGSEPNWNSIAIGATVTDNGAVWKNMGVAAVWTNGGNTAADGPSLVWAYEGINDCSGDAVIIDLTPLI